MFSVFKNTVSSDTPFCERLQLLFIEKGIDLSTRGWSEDVAYEMYNADPPLLELKHEYKGKDAYEDGDKAIARLKNSAANRMRIHVSKTQKASSVSGEWLNKYCQYFGCSAAYLFGEINAPTPEIAAIQELTGLSNRATKQLLYLYKNSAKMPIASEMLDTLNLILSNASKMSDILQAVGTIAGTVHYNDSADDLPPLPDMNTADPAFIKVVQERRLMMAAENLK